MSRPVVLTEAQLRAAVAVAEAVERHHEFIRIAGTALNTCTIDGPMIPKAGMESVYKDAIASACRAQAEIEERAREYRAIRPDAQFEVRSIETLARIVAEKTDGGIECRARDGLLSEVLREFEGREVRDGAR